MAITASTNMQSLRIRINLGYSTEKMNTTMERMSSGYRVNSAEDDAAGVSITKKMNSKISSAKIASDNVAIGQNLLGLTEETLGIFMDNLQRIKDLATEAANGTYASSDLDALKFEAQARADEIDRLANSPKFNSKPLFGGSAASTGITLQIGYESLDTLNIDHTIFATATSAGLGLIGGTATYGTIASAFATSTTANVFLDDIDNAITNYTNRVTAVGAYQNRLSSIAENLNIQQTNLSSAVSTIKDADVAEESAVYVKHKILQSASATLLVQSNSAPQIALALIR
jgi:flagellin